MRPNFLLTCDGGKEEMLHLKNNIIIGNATPADAAAIAQIYNDYINKTIITFEEQQVTPSELNKRIQGIL